MQNDPSPLRLPPAAAAAAILVGAAWLSAGAAPFRDAGRGAFDPVDFARDYVTARARIEDGRGAPPPEGEAGNARAAAFGAPEILLYGAYYHAHPPPARLPVRPLGFLPWRTAAMLWAAGSVLALGWLAISLLAIVGGGRSPAAGWVGLATVALALWPPVLHCFEKGQWSILLAALLAGGFVALDGGRARRAGVLFGRAAAFKVTPIVLLAFLAARDRRAARAMAATVAVAIAASLAVDGAAPWRAFAAGAARNAQIWAPWSANTASLAGVYARLFGPPGPFARPWITVPGLAGAAFDLTALAFVGAAAALLLRLRGARGADRETPAPLAAAWLALPVLINPLGWTHVLVMMLAPLAIAWRQGGRGLRAAALLALAAFSIPREALAHLAGPIPLAPARGLFIGVHAAAAVALFAALLRAARTTRSAGAL